MKNLVQRIVLLLTIGLAGCNTSYYHQNGSSPRGPLMGDTKVDYVATDAKQRIVNYIDVAPGNFDKNTRSITPQRLVCSEPSPDVASAVQFAIDAAAKYNNGKTDASAGVSASFAESLLQLGKRIATVQLLRDELADLCRTYANGAITGATYSIRLSRLDKKMVTLLSSEAAAGALTDTSRAIAGSAGVSKTGNPEEVAAARKAAAAKADEVKAAANALANNTDTAKAAALGDTLKAKTAELVELNNTLALATLENSNRSLSSSAQISSANGGNVTFNVSTEVLEDIQDNYLRVDDASIIIDTCMTNMVESVRGGMLALADESAKMNSQRAAELTASGKEGEDDEVKDLKAKVELWTTLKKKVGEKLWEVHGDESAALYAGLANMRDEKTSATEAERAQFAKFEVDLRTILGKDSLSLYCSEKALPKMYDLMNKQADYKAHIELKKYEVENTKAQAQKAEAEAKKAEAESNAALLKAKEDLAAAKKATDDAKDEATNAANELKACQTKKPATGKKKEEEKKPAANPKP
ncbi:MAG: hypothetical protein HY849_02570 [Nitrosomonadales bacterium]|nr:hypothetical protein [Nitrosomonadales bacterium]